MEYKRNLTRLSHVDGLLCALRTVGEFVGQGGQRTDSKYRCP